MNRKQFITTTVSAALAVVSNAAGLIEAPVEVLPPRRIFGLRFKVKRVIWAFNGTADEAYSYISEHWDSRTSLLFHLREGGRIGFGPCLVTPNRNIHMLKTNGLVEACYYFKLYREEYGS